ncbi:MAG TPA: FHA domain-containing protein, partial [Candidatus Krumholzibacterium sp.]|nr:FHA domain-containing protein [Candidatus Krumholzibacterium sp.]
LASGTACDMPLAPDRATPAGYMARQTGGTPAAPDHGRVSDQPRLYRRNDHEEYSLDDEKTIIGRSRNADIRLSGLFAPRVTVEITRSGDDFIIQKTDGRRDMCINGEALNEKVLEEEDLIAIGPEEFVFKK